ncbi:MAG: class I SAM-dependent methyltransferase [Bryobacteraceae bacterium]
MAAESAAGNATFHDLVQQQVARLSTKGWYHSIELPDGSVIQGMIGIDALKARLAAFPIPADLTGKRVLDVGAWTGWCSFEMERRGAEVAAVDCIEFEEFREAHRLIGSRVDYRILDVDELTPESVGLFDYVLFFGVLYHLRNPLLGLEKICAITKDTAFVESFVTDDGSAPCAMEFYETDELGGQIDNWFGPSVKCAAALCRSAGFARVNLEYVSERRTGFTCRRRWEPAPADPTEPAPLLYSAVNNRTHDIEFHPGKDEYICAYFRSEVPDITRDRVRIEVDELGAPVLVLANLRAQEWQANLRVPPGLAPGPHTVRLRTAGSGYSNSFEVRYGTGSTPRATSATPAASPAQPAPVIYELSNGMTDTNVFQGHRNEYIRCRFRTAETGIDRAGVILQIDEAEQPVLFLTDVGGGRWQINSRLPLGLAPGEHRVRVRTAASGFSDSNSFELRGFQDRPGK